MTKKNKLHGAGHDLFGLGSFLTRIGAGPQEPPAYESSTEPRRGDGTANAEALNFILDGIADGGEMNREPQGKKSSPWDLIDLTPPTEPSGGQIRRPDPPSFRLPRPSPRELLEDSFNVDVWPQNYDLNQDGAMSADERRKYHEDLSVETQKRGYQNFGEDLKNRPEEWPAIRSVLMERTRPSAERYWDRQDLNDREVMNRWSSGIPTQTELQLNVDPAQMRNIMPPEIRMENLQDLLQSIDQKSTVAKSQQRSPWGRLA